MISPHPKTISKNIVRPLALRHKCRILVFRNKTLENPLKLPRSLGFHGFVGFQLGLQGTPRFERDSMGCKGLHGLQGTPWVAKDSKGRQGLDGISVGGGGGGGGGRRGGGGIFEFHQVASQFVEFHRVASEKSDY